MLIRWYWYYKVSANIHGVVLTYNKFTCVISTITYHRYHDYCLLRISLFRSTVSCMIYCSYLIRHTTRPNCVTTSACDALFAKYLHNSYSWWIYSFWCHTIELDYKQLPMSCCTNYFATFCESLMVYTPPQYGRAPDIHVTTMNCKHHGPFDFLE